MKKKAGGWIPLIFKWVLPRPADVLAKMWFFAYGMLAALVIGGELPGDQVSLINVLFRPSTSWQSNDVPIWAIAALLLVYLILEELLVQQAKLIWDDIRDRERDRKLLHNKERAIARGDLSLQHAIWNMIVRLGVVALFVVWQGRGDLLLVFGLILLHQAVYLFWAKPRGSRHPLRMLLWLSFNNSLRFLAGIVAITGFQALLPFILMFIVFYFCSVGGLAAQWKMEAEYAGKDIRPQSKYFFMKGEFWQHVGLVNAVLVTCFLFFVHPLSLCHTWFALLHMTDTLHCSHGYLNLEALGIVVPLVLIGLFMVVGMAFVSLFQKSGLGNVISQGTRKIKGQALLLLGFVVIASGCMMLSSFFLAGIKPYNTFLLVFILLMINMMYMILYEGMTYPEFANFGVPDNAKKERE
jgi:4-hydroxybenzoate polyprenyltransferase